MDYAIIKLGNKQHRVRDGETLVVDRVRTDAGASFEPDVLLGDGPVTATVIAHERGPKILVGKYRKRTGYKRHNGFRAATSRVEISLGGSRTERAEGAKPAGSAPATARLDGAETSAPETVVPETVVPETVVPETVVPETVVPEAVVPEAVVPEAVVPDAAAPAAVAAAETSSGTEVSPVAEVTALPEGYEGMTVAQVVAAARGWAHDEVEAALAYEQDHAARKGALSALESALAKEDG